MNAKKISLTIVVPVYNEENRIELLFRSLEEFKSPESIEFKEIRLVNDGSTDKTLEKIREWINKDKRHFKVKVRLITYLKNKGRGFALRTGLKNIKTDYAMYLDGDGDISINNLVSCLSYLQARVDLIIGSKKMPGAVCKGKIKPLRWLMGYGHTGLASLILGVFVWDFQGGFKIFSKRLLDELLSKTVCDEWGFDLEIIYWAKKLNYMVKEVPLSWGSVIEGSKVKVLRDVYRAIRDMLRIRKDGLIWKMEKKLEKARLIDDLGVKFSLAK